MKPNAACRLLSALGAFLATACLTVAASAPPVIATPTVAGPRA